MNTTASPRRPADDNARRRVSILARRFAALLCLCLGAHGAAQAACPPGASTKFALQVLKQVGWKVADEGPRQALAIALLDCLASPDPELRDGIAFDALSTWARGRALTPATLETIRATLVPRLAPDAADEAGFAQPFAALVLAEVARADRVQPYLSDAERGEMVRAGTAYLASVHDYRGFDAVDGWRHGVAHGADLLLQLSLNLALDRSHLDAILAAITTQVMPPGHFYIYGEGERLMAPVFYVGRRGLLTTAEWSAWFAGLATRRVKPAQATQASLAATHDLTAFLLPLYASLKESGSPEMQAQMLPGVAAALKTLD
jgi:hypothetical protein